MVEERALTVKPDNAPTGQNILWTKRSVVRLDAIPRIAPDVFRRVCIEACGSGSRVAALTCIPAGQDASEELQDLLAILVNDTEQRMGFLRAEIPENKTYQSLTPDLPQVQGFERELFELYGVRPDGHPWLKALRRHQDLENQGRDVDLETAAHPFFRVEGSGVHEVAVGPVHAGIIEPGHFRFQCQGEKVLSLEIQLGYQHRGAEALLLRSAPSRRLMLAESIAGDTVIGHAQAYCMAMEALASVEVPLAAQSLRAVALELERLSNHVGDLGALCNDIGYLPGASWFGRLRGEFLNLLMQLSGNRFGRSLLRTGGVRFGLSAPERKNFLSCLSATERDLKTIADLTFESASVTARFEHTGFVSREWAETLGLVGPVARASGCDRDVRRDHAFGIFRLAQIPVALMETGDVMARALVRWLETQRSLSFVREQLEEMPDGPLAIDPGPCRPQSLVVSMVEGWRGEIVHVAITDKTGQLSHYKVVDPSFHNWFGLAMALRGQQISDFPLCNKSFNLSYAGHDL
jgi:Ni,Fe-hydrogenase III large subunit/NADH:ubiquinone oxidoreductase subunit C